jgi:acetyl-CoA carboxylase alpha subunit
LYRVEVERNELHDKVLKLTSVYDRMNEVRVENEDLKKKNTDLVRRVFYFIYTSQKYQISRYSQRILFVFLILGGESGKFETTDYSSS